MQKSRFFFVEPSKVGTQHITLIEGYLRAVATSVRLARTHDLTFASSKSTFKHLAADIRENVKFERVIVMNPDKRRLILKTIVEFFVVLRYLLKVRQGDILFVSCVLPTTLVALELTNLVLRRNDVHITLHGETEGLYDETLNNIKSYGYWIKLWLHKRRLSSKLSLVVLDNFIKQRLLKDFPSKFSDNQISVIYHPIIALAFSTNFKKQSTKAEVCFIGYRTRFKGFEQFEALSCIMADLRFVSIGGGFIRDIPNGDFSCLESSADYINAIARCSVAIFPYTGGYTASLSAAVLDALSAGVHVLATRRACFVALADYFGSDFVTLYDSEEEASLILSNNKWLEMQDCLQTSRLAQLANSRYEISGVMSCFERLIPVSK
jgi:hypothetical protein